MKLLIVLVFGVGLSAAIGSSLGGVVALALRRLWGRVDASRPVGPSDVDLRAASIAREARVEEFRERFRVAPIGRWTGASGTFGVVMDETWRFCPDGTGEYREYGPFGHPSGGERRFEWKACQDRTISIRGMGHDPDGWVTVRYDFRAVPTDSGLVVALVGVDGLGGAREGFGRGLAGVMEQPLSYVGPADGEGRPAADTS